MNRVIKIITIALTAVNFLHADIVQDYLAKDYKKICTMNNISKYRKDEKALSIIGVSCIKLDSLYLLPYIINKLKHTNYGRKNSIYFLTILMQKKLLYSYFFDHISLESFSFPMTDYILSKIFNEIKYGNYEKVGNMYIIKEDNNKMYKVYIKEDKMFVDEYDSGKLIKRRWYR